MLRRFKTVSLIELQLAIDSEFGRCGEVGDIPQILIKYANVSSFRIGAEIRASALGLDASISLTVETSGAIDCLSYVYAM